MAFQIISQDEFNIFTNFNREQYTKVRERIIGMVLATDMTHHFTDIAKLKARLCAGLLIKILSSKTIYYFRFQSKR